MQRSLRIMAIKAITGPTAQALAKEQALLQRYAGPLTHIELVQAAAGTASIESDFDIALAAVETLRLVLRAQRERYDGVFITCWGNANLDAARELSEIPVTASGEASMLLAASLGQRFSVIATLPESRRRHELEATKLGVGGKFCSERSLDMRVLDLKQDPQKTFEAFLRAGRRCIEEDGADVLVPGCFGFAGLAQELQAALQVPVVEPAGAVVRHIETLALLGLSHSKRAWPKPRPKARDYGFDAAAMDAEAKTASD